MLKVNRPARIPAQLGGEIAARTCGKWVNKPSKPSEVERPGYYPTYTGLTPEQKWVYLDWLEDIIKPIDIGYVFIFYYGLERRLLLGEFDDALDVTLNLRKHHQNRSFQSYTKNAIVYATIAKNRQDRIPDLFFLLEEDVWDNSQLLLSYKCQPVLTATDSLKVVRSVRETNKRYLKECDEIYLAELGGVLRDRYGSPEMPFRDLFNVLELPTTKEICFANISFPEHVRSLDVPDVHGFPPFREAIIEIA